MNALRDASVLVLGLGDSGLAMARWCARHGAAVCVWDSREQPPQAAALRAEWPQIECRFGVEAGAAVPAGVTLLLKSPGLAPHDARIAPLLAAARAAGVAVLGELDVFVHALADLKRETAAPPDADAAADAAPPAAYAPAVLAITGTNGKTTTTALTALLVESAGRRVAVAGNIGPTMLDRLSAMQALPRAEWAEVWVLELSSFQLADARCAAEGGFAQDAADGGFEPAAAALLNLSQDHLDWHGDMAAYAQAKARVFGRGTTVVFNRDDAQVRALVQARVQALTPAPTAAKATRAKPRPPAGPVPPLRGFGLGAPTRPGDFGLVVDAGMAWLARALPADDTVKRRRDEAEEIHLQRLMPADALRIRGRHNAANALAALALATAIGCPLAPLLRALADYAGEPHRVQPLGVVGGVEAYDDSKGTNVGATVAALEGLGAEKAPHKLLLILGGDGKGQDFAPLAAPLAGYARGAALIGRDAPRLRQALGPALHAAGVPLADAATLPEAVAWCFAQARPGDAVLLSPACASLDMFRNYAHRADVFAQAVRAWAAERGDVL
jgi:UDP-N-acetylmuramoylalanine--D-glutamate ligase